MPSEPYQVYVCFCFIVVIKFQYSWLDLPTCNIINYKGHFQDGIKVFVYFFLPDNDLDWHVSNGAGGFVILMSKANPNAEGPLSEIKLVSKTCSASSLECGY